MQSVTFGTYLTFRKSVKRVVYFPQVKLLANAKEKQMSLELLKTVTCNPMIKILKKTTSNILKPIIFIKSLRLPPEVSKNIYFLLFHENHQSM